MKTGMTCEDFRAMLLAERVGGLTSDDRSNLDAHRLVCPACAEEARMDAWLCGALEQMPEETPPAVTWAQVLAAHRPERRRATARRVALAFATAAAIVVFLLLHPFDRPQPGTVLVQKPPTPGAAVAAETSPYTGAHAMLSASDMTGDPNRDVILVYGAPPGKSRS